MDAWLTEARDTIAAAAKLSPAELDVDDATAEELLRVARVAAHESGERTNAPLLAYLVGVAVGRGGDFAVVSEAATSAR